MKKCLLILFTSMFSCHTGSERKPVEDFDFATTDDSELFFKNLRQSDYDKIEMKEAGLDIFRMSDRNEDATYPLVHLAIANNWRNDRAYIMVEPNEYVELPAELLLIGADTSLIQYDQGNTQRQLEFALQLFDAINAEKQILLKSTKTPIFEKGDDREILRRTMVDYQMLVRLTP